MSDTDTFCGTIEWLGWDKPAIELVAKQLLKLGAEHPDEFRRAWVVVPTAESGRSLREHMAAAAKGKDNKRRPTLMPRITLVGHLLDDAAEDVATERETMAAWLQVMLEVAENLPSAKYETLFPHAPLGDKETWALSMSNRLRQVRRHLEQEELTADYAERLQHVTLPDGSSDAALQRYLYRMGSRWGEMQALFARVDGVLHMQKKRTQEEARAALIQQPQHRGTLIMACVPEVTPQIRSYLCALSRKADAAVRIWVNAPQGEAHVDAFGQPLTTHWQGCPIEIPNALVTETIMQENGKGTTILRDDLSRIHQRPGTKELAETAVRLAGGHSSSAVCVAACDAAVAPALQTAFRYAPGKRWMLNLPAGRSFLMTPAGQLPAQLLAACQAFRKLPDFNPQTLCVAENTAPMLTMAEPLLRNETLQQMYCRKTKEYGALRGFNAHLDKVMARWLPSSVSRLLQVVGQDPMDKKREDKRDEAARQRAAAARLIYTAYVREVAKALEMAQRLKSLAALLKEWGTYLPKVCTADPLKKPAEMLAQMLTEFSDFAVSAPKGMNALMLLLLLQQETEQRAAAAMAAVPREESCGDIVGWRELTYTASPHLLLCGMHHGAVPEAPQGDAVLPDALRVSFGITSSASREARDAFLLTGLLKSHEVHFLLARHKEDGTPIVPSSLLLRCATPEELAQRAALLFADDKEIPEEPQQEKWSLLQAQTPADNQPESLALFGRAADNPYALRENGDNKTFSPSRLNDFLRCPLRFWLKTVWLLSPGDAYQEDHTEIPNNDYGTLMHIVLQEIVKRYPDAASVEGMDKETLGNAVAALTRQLIEKEYGSHLSLPLEAQTELLQANMRLFAEKHWDDLGAGWENVALEQELSPELEMPEAPAVFSMTADRIDRKRNKADGSWEYRIIDYKSNDKNPNGTHAAHLQDEAQSPYRRLLPAWTFEVKGKGFYRWKNVQLPLYALGLRKWVEETYGTPMPPHAMPELAYYNIPSGKVEVKYNKLCATEELGSGTRNKKNFAAEDIEQALVCVRDVIAKIRAGECLYSAESLGGETLSYADFGALCTDGDPRTLCGLPALPQC